MVGEPVSPKTAVTGSIISAGAVKEAVGVDLEGIMVGIRPGQVQEGVDFHGSCAHQVLSSWPGPTPAKGYTDLHQSNCCYKSEETHWRLLNLWRDK